MTPYYIFPAIVANLLFILAVVLAMVSYDAWKDGCGKASAAPAMCALSFLGWGIYALTWYVR